MARFSGKARKPVEWRYTAERSALGFGLYDNQAKRFVSVTDLTKEAADDLAIVQMDRQFDKMLVNLARNMRVI